MHKFDPGAYDRLLRKERETEERPRVMLKELGIKEGAFVLDLGCGPGFYIPFIKSLVGNTGLVVGSDIQIEMLKIARLHLIENGVKGIYLVLNGEDNLPFASNTFDFVLMVHTLHELRNPLLLLTEINRILKRNGELILWDWDRKYDGPPGPPKEERLNPHQAETLLHKAGFDAIRVRNYLPYRFFFKGRKK